MSYPEDKRAVSPSGIAMTQQYPPSYYPPPQPSVLVTQPTNAMAVQVEAKPIWSWCLTVTSVLTALFCSCTFGSLGVLQAIHAYVDHKTGDYTRARNKRNCGWGFTIAGLVIGIIIWICVFIFITGYLRLLIAMMQDRSSRRHG